MATYEERQSAALTTTVSWLEDELREAKSVIAKQQQAIEQLAGQIWELTDALHRAEDLLATLPPRLEALPEYDSQLRQVKDDLGRVHEHGLATEARLGELSRLQATEVERGRAVLNDLSHRMEAGERALQTHGPRFDALDEASRRAMEALTHVRQRVEETERTAEGLETRMARVTETGGRTEQEFARLESEIETLHRQDATLAERVQIYTEMIKRLEGQISLVSASVAVKQDTLERIELVRAGLHRLEERISIQEAIAADLRDADEEARRLVAILDSRDKGMNERLTGLQGDLAGYRATVAEQFHRLHQAQERAKRRQIEDLEREIREMRTHAFRPVDDGS